MGKGVDYNININNRKASYEYKLLVEFEAGILLKGTEVKSIRKNGASLAGAYCYLNNNQLIVKNMHISALDNAEPHEPMRDRVLLLKKKELKKIASEVKNSGITIVVKRLYNVKGLLKMQICIAQGKKLYDKRESIKIKDVQRDLKRSQSYE